MRKILLIISLVTVVAMEANAQTRNVRYGMKLGPTFDWASSGSTAAANEGFQLGTNLGLVCDYYVASNFALSSGVDFNILNMKYTFTDRRYVEDFLEAANVSVLRRLNAINVEIPVKAKFNYDVVDSFKAYVEAGFGLGVEYELDHNFSAFAQLAFDHSFSNAFVRSIEQQTGSILRNNYIGVVVGIITH